MKIKLLLLTILIGLSPVFAGIKFKLNNRIDFSKYNSVYTESFCNGKLEFENELNKIAWDFQETEDPYSKDETKQILIQRFEACLNSGLAALKKEKPKMKEFAMMIPEGLFLTSNDLKNYEEDTEENYELSTRNNFKNFSTWAEPIFKKYYSNLKVVVWEWGW